MVMTYETALSLLNITEIKDLHALQKCFRRKALHCHPDKIAHQLEKEAKTSTKPTEEFQHVLEAFEFLEKKLLNNNSDLKSLEFSTEDTLQAYQINLSETENVGLDTFFFSCRCGYDVTIDLDFATQHHHKKMIKHQKEPAAIQNKVTTCEEKEEKNFNLEICQNSNISFVKNVLAIESSSTSQTFLNKTTDPTDENEETRGIVYVSRIPCFMNATKLRQYMENFGKVHRIFLTPENPVERKKRLRAGGSKKIMFKDGWIEFDSKKVAKFVGNHLNNTPVGGPKRHNFWREDIWNLRYLSKFKWHHLLEYHTGKKKAREVSRALELQQMRRENTHYLEQVEKKRKNDIIALNRLTKKKKKEGN